MTFQPDDGSFEVLSYEVVHLPSPERAEQAIEELVKESAKAIRNFKIE